MTFTTATAHLIHGGYVRGVNEEERMAYARRVVEMHVLNRWAKSVQELHPREAGKMLLLGDFNVPRMKQDEPMYRKLCSYGMGPLDYSTRTGGSNLGNDGTYDQIVFAPGPMEGRIKKFGVFDFDNVLFRKLWKRIVREEEGKEAQVRRYNQSVQWHISDHRPVWVELKR